MEGLASPFEFIKEGLATIWSWLENIFSAIGNIASNILSGLGDFFSILWDWLGKLFTAIGNIATSILEGLGSFFSTLWTWLTDIFGAITKIPETIIKLLGDLLNWLFVPSNNPFESLSSKFDEKFAFVGQIKDLFSSLLGFNNYGENVPSFTLTWYGATVAIIDFSLFLNYRTWIHGIILAIAWTVFIFKTYRKLPSIIGGFSQ